jgi:hypothetical protein
MLKWGEVPEKCDQTFFEILLSTIFKSLVSASSYWSVGNTCIGTFARKVFISPLFLVYPWARTV